MGVLNQRGLVARNASMFIDEYDMTGQGHEVKLKRDAATIDVTPFGRRISVDLAGIQKSSYEFKSYYGPGLAGYNEVVNQKFGQDSDVYLGFAAQGWGALNDITMLPVVITKYDLDAKTKGAIEVDMSAMTRGSIDIGYQLFAPTTFLTTTGSPWNSNVMDYTLKTGSTTAGCAAYLSVQTVAGATPSLAMKIQMSPDGTTWTDVPGLAFTAATKATKQRLELPVGTFVDAQIRAVGAVTGTGASFSVMCGFARNVIYS
jgi:hypothetical protein